MSKIEDFPIQNWQQQLNNCFEVNINSSRLNDLLTDIMSKLQAQQEKIMAINDKVSYMSDSTAKKVKQSYSDCNFLIMELRNEIKNQIKDSKAQEKQHEKLLAQRFLNQDQYTEKLTKQIERLKSQMNQRAKEFQIMDQNYFGGMIRETIADFQNSKKQIPEGQNQSSESDCSGKDGVVNNDRLGKSIKFSNQVQLGAQSSLYDAHKSRFFKIDVPKLPPSSKNLFHKIQILKQQFQMYREQSKVQFEKLNQLLLKQDFTQSNVQSYKYVKGKTQQKVFKNPGSTIYPSNFADFQKSQTGLKSKKKLDDAEKKLQFAIFSSKLEKLQKAIEEINSQTLNKVMYPRPSQKKLRSKRRSTFFKRATQYEMEQKEEYQFTTQARLIQDQQISNKMTVIEQRISHIQSQLSRQISFAKDRVTIIEEKHQFVMRRIDKLVNDSNQTKLSLKKLFDSIIQEQVILNLRKDIKKLNKDMEMGLQLQLTKHQFIKQQAKVTNKINILHQHLSDKADKDEIKRALIFLEDKVKEIVVLIAHGQIDEKNGALSRAPFKCLSCDRDVETLKNTSHQKLRRQKQVDQNKRPKSIQRITNKVHAKMRIAPTVTLMTQVPVDSD